MTAVATNEIASLARCALSAASQVVALGVGARSRRCGARSPARLLDPSSLRALAVSWVLPPARRSLVSLRIPFADGPPDFTSRRYHNEGQPDDYGALLVWEQVARRQMGPDGGEEGYDVVLLVAVTLTLAATVVPVVQPDRHIMSNIEGWLDADRLMWRARRAYDMPVDIHVGGISRITGSRGERSEFNEDEVFETDKHQGLIRCTGNSRWMIAAYHMELLLWKRSGPVVNNHHRTIPIPPGQIDMKWMTATTTSSLRQSDVLQLLILDNGAAQVHLLPVDVPRSFETSSLQLVSSIPSVSCPTPSLAFGPGEFFWNSNTGDIFLPLVLDDTTAYTLQALCVQTGHTVQLLQSPTNLDVIRVDHTHFAAHCAGSGISMLLPPHCRCPETGTLSVFDTNRIPSESASDPCATLTCQGSLWSCKNGLIVTTTTSSSQDLNIGGGGQQQVVIIVDCSTGLTVAQVPVRYTSKIGMW